MRRDGQSQRSAVKSRLWLMNKEPLPSHWAEFTSSHNHFSLFPTFASVQHLHIHLLSFPSFCRYHYLYLFFSLHLLFMLFLSFITNASLMCLVFSLSSSPCPESFHICSLWDKKNNPEPWNKLDPTYQYKVTIPITRTDKIRPPPCSQQSCLPDN